MKRTQTFITSACGAICLLAGGVVFAQSDQLSAADKKFVQEAAIGGKLEVELGKVAAQQGSNEKIKKFGQKMVDDHGKAGDDLHSLAMKKGLNPPAELDAKHKAVLDKMSAMSGSAFDKAYAKDMVEDHEEDIAEFQKEAASGSDPDLKNWASSTLPTLKEHLRMAKEAMAAVSGGTE